MITSTLECLWPVIMTAAVAAGIIAVCYLALGAIIAPITATLVRLANKWIGYR